MWKSVYAKYPLFLSDFNGTWIFLIVAFRNFANALKTEVHVAYLKVFLPLHWGTNERHSKCYENNLFTYS
jgi:hypothetical protein